MRKTREEKAITLIALIITIVVLLILAVVAINSVTGDGIIQHAVNAKTSYENAQAKEQGMLAYYETYLQTEGKEGKWVQEGTTLRTTNTDGTITEVKIGDYVKYDAGSHTHTPDNSKGAGTSQPTGNAETGYNFLENENPLTTENLNWRVLGVNGKGELELISEKPTTQTLFLANDEGYINAEENLNNCCNDLYGRGVNDAGKRVATGARSLNVDDINKVSGYNPVEENSSYGNKWIYKYPTTDEVNASTTGLTNNIWYKIIKADGTLVKDWSNTTKLEYTTFRLPGETTAISSTNPGSKEVMHSAYGYNIPYDGVIITENLASQWLASRVIFCKGGWARFGIRNIYNNGVSSNFLFNSYGDYGDCFDYHVRPIVTLSNEVSLAEDNSNNGNEHNVWKIL